MSNRITEDLTNLIIGGEFTINPWQRGTNFVSPASGDYTADRFQYRNVGSADYTISQNASSPTFAQPGLISSNSLDITVTTASASPGASDFTTIEQPMEGYVAVPAYGDSLALSFHVFSNITGTFCVALQNGLRNRSFIREYTIDAASTWERKTMFINHDETGTWAFDETVGMRLIFAQVAGTSLQGTNNIWQNGDIIGTANQTNLAAAISNNFRVDLIQFRLGSQINDFVMRERANELLLCLRYYEKSYNISVNPGSVTQVGESACKQASDSEIRTLQNTLRGTKRTTPSMVWYSPVTGAINNIHRYNAAADHAVIATTSTGQRSTGWPTIGSSVGTEWGAHWTAESEL